MRSDVSRWLAGLSAQDSDKRMQAAEQLAQLGAAAQPAALALVLACGDETEEVRQWAASALEGIGPPDTADVGQLASFLDGRSPDVGYWAATLLGRLKAGAVAAVDALARAVVESPHLAVRQRAAWALGEIGPAAAAALPSLRKAAGDSDRRLARLAQQAIGRVGGS
jgi:HEAT repeat protein